MTKPPHPLEVYQPLPFSRRAIDDLAEMVASLPTPHCPPGLRIALLTALARLRELEAKKTARKR